MSSSVLISHQRGLHDALILAGVEITKSGLFLSAIFSRVELSLDLGSHSHILHMLHEKDLEQKLCHPKTACNGTLYRKIRNLLMFVAKQTSPE